MQCEANAIQQQSFRSIILPFMEKLNFEEGESGRQGEESRVFKNIFCTESPCDRLENKTKLNRELKIDSMAIR